MDPSNRRRLQQYQQDILKDLDVSHIFDRIFSQNVLSDDDTENILKLKGRSEKAKYLLETIIKYGNNKTFEVFVDSLAKDYKWLWEKLAVENNEEMVDNSFEDSLSKGDVPRLPDHHVRRQNIEQIVATKLKQLTRHKFLVLHGMPKSGKTCVAISVLRNNPELITNNFNGVVLWLNFGAVKLEDEIIAQQSKLLRKATSIYMPNNSFMMNSSISMSSIGSNADSHSTSNNDYTLGNIRDTLKAQFLEPQLKECLLVLDKVNDRKCVEAFDIGCKILITTRDTEVVRDCDPQIIEIENSFKEHESLELFASCLDEPVSKLPSHAKRLNEICKGSPFLITLIGAQLAENKERLKHDTRHWKYYLNKLEKKDLFDLFSWRTHDNPMKTIEFCINSLDEKILPLYKKLAILPDNVKVSAKVLSKLWKKELNVVESIMKKLKSKSLIIEYYDREQMNYIYEVDDLLMNYLKTSKKDYEEDSKRMHYNFLKSYRYDNVDKVPLEIEDDGYIAYYVGYHILNTKDYNNNWSLFKKLFMDLKFLGNKVRLTGPDDVTMDLQKYESYIASDTLDVDLLHNIKAFLRTHGTDLYRYPCTDIVQSILQHESQGVLYRKASIIAQENCEKNELYFEFLHEHDVDEIRFSTIDVKENITAVCFLGDYVLVGTNNGAIKFFHIPTNKLKKELHGTGSPIKWIGVACLNSPPTVAALCYDGVIKLWHVDDIYLDDSNSIIDEEPEERYTNNFARNLVPTINPKLGAFVHCRWTNNEDYLITQTTKCIIIYHPNGEIFSVINNFERDRELLCCVPCYKDSYVAVATCGNSDKNVELVNLKTKERLIAFEETDTVIDILTVPDSNKIITLKQKEILEREFRISPNALNKCSPCRCRTVIQSGDVKENLSFLAMAINKTGTLLFVSTDDSRVVVVDLKSYSRVFDLENRRGNVVAMAVSEMLMWDEFEPSSDVLLTGTDSTENSAKVWYLDATYISQKNSKVRLTTKFDVSFLNPSSPVTPTSTVANSATESANSTPRRHQSFAYHKEVSKKVLKNTMSLDRQSIKPLNLKGICNNNDSTAQPLLAVVDDKNNIQVMRGRKVLTEILEKSEEQITAVKISPCNHFIFYGLRSGIVKKYTLRTKEVVTIVDVYSPVQYLNFVNSTLLMVAGKNRCLMAYHLTSDGDWEPEMLQAGNTHLGSQELLNDLQGVKKKNGQSDNMSSSGSDSSLSSRDRTFPSGEHKGLCKGSSLVQCYWIAGVGLITVEHNAAIKLWDDSLKLSRILNARQPHVHVTCSAFQRNILVICDSNNKGFQTFELKTEPLIELQAIQDYKLNNVIVSCDLTADGNILALGLDSGNVVIQNVKWKRQICLLRHHKTKVQSCSFSPVTERMYRSSMLFSPASNALSPPTDSTDEEVPLVLVTMASEIVWWNLSYIMRMRVNNRNLWSRSGMNVLTPLASPSDLREAHTPNNSPEVKNFFFNTGVFNQYCWKAIWKGKTCKEGSKRKEILACIKLSGMNAKRLCHDERFSCFVTVDNPGHVHIMNVMRSTNT